MMNSVGFGILDWLDGTVGSSTNQGISFAPLLWRGFGLSFQFLRDFLLLVFKSSRLLVAKQCIHIFNEESTNFRMQIEARQLVWPISNLGGRASGMAQKELKKEVAHLVTVTNWVPKQLPNCEHSFPSGDAVRFVEDGKAGSGQC